MLVYRICDEDEIDSILGKHSFENVGGYGSRYIKRQKTKNINNHDYNENEKYLHFFKDKGSICYMSTNKGRYICVYDIPKAILNESYGIGKYWECFNFSYLEDVEEYAIKTKYLKFDYLVKVDRIYKYIDAEDYLYDHSLDGHLDPIYDNGFKNELLNKDCSNLYITKQDKKVKTIKKQWN